MPDCYFFNCQDFRGLRGDGGCTVSIRRVGQGVHFWMGGQSMMGGGAGGKVYFQMLVRFDSMRDSGQEPSGEWISTFV
jgi:hypothetical protein